MMAFFGLTVHTVCDHDSVFCSTGADEVLQLALHTRLAPSSFQLAILGFDLFLHFDRNVPNYLLV